MVAVSNRGMTMLSSNTDLNSNPEVAINANDHDWTLSLVVLVSSSILGAIK